MFYVYEWYVKNTNEIFYVGKGCIAIQELLKNLKMKMMHSFMSMKGYWN